MQDTESLLCDQEHSFALFLAKAGFDVWLGKEGPYVIYSSCVMYPCA